MEKTLIIILIISVIVFLIAISLIFIFINKNKIKTVSKKILLVDKDLSENLKNKLDLVRRAINIIERELKIESKKFEEVKKVTEKTNNIVLDGVLLEAACEIMDIKDDYKELSKTKSFDGIIKEIKDVDILLSGGKEFYNKYADEYNNMIKKFPTSAVSKKCKQKILYTVNMINNNTKIDFTI